tara:strand:- start:213 stop:545 length:333 start_codon:yes stop_codon:yes gene_type:complete
MPLPFKRIKVVSTDYKVELLPQEECDTYSVAGVCHQTPQDPKIRVAKHKEPTALADTMLHEIMHACWTTMNLDAREEEERAVAALATALIAVMRDNPNFSRWLIKQCGVK